MKVYAVGYATGKVGFIYEGVPTSGLRNCLYLLFLFFCLGPRKYCKECCCVVTKYVVLRQSSQYFIQRWLITDKAGSLVVQSWRGSPGEVKN